MNFPRQKTPLGYKEAAGVVVWLVFFFFFFSICQVRFQIRLLFMLSLARENDGGCIRVERRADNWSLGDDGAAWHRRAGGGTHGGAGRSAAGPPFSNLIIIMIENIAAMAVLAPLCSRVFGSWWQKLVLPCAWSEERVEEAAALGEDAGCQEEQEKRGETEEEEAQSALG